MMRTLAELVAGALLILALAIYFLFLTPLVNAAPSRQWPCTTASWYGTESGRHTATGEKFDGRSLTAAMPSPKHLGERYRVHYGSKSVDVRVNDVGPARYLHRGIDLSRAAAKRIGLIGAGVGTVCLERLN